ncbi:MAG: NUDIX hydrolase [Candidatus Micrarchaeota archaeon]|nr:NUDIX hydrolase [Candidatus Micrarchaeota archaeon]
MEMNFRPTAVDVVICHRGKILLIKRKKYPFKGKWALPGGFVEINENVQDAAVREVKEETGLDIELIDVIGIYSEPYRDRRNTISIAFLATIKNNDKIKVDKKEIDDAKFFTFKKIPKLAFDHNKMIEDAMVKIKKCGFCEDCNC